ncbi:MAG: LamG domain-containing protein [Deltaproteobacteria bacterium]|nr:LamG domain-containing protein [Deltaproteobacteria bacterium]
MDAVRRSSWVAVVLVAGALAACPSKDSSTPGQARKVANGTHAPATDGGSFARADGSVPAPRTCDEDGGVLCPDGCCGSGQTCAPDGGCEAASVSGSCPADAPVACSAPVGCPGGTCLAFDVSPSHDHVTLTAPAAFVPGRYGTGVSTKQGNCQPIDLSARGVGLPTGNAPETIEFWYRADSSPNFPSQSVLLVQGTDRYLQLNGGTVLSWLGAVQASAAADQWHFVAATYSSQSCVLAVDGVAHTGVHAALNTPADAGLTLGGTPSTNCAVFPGTVDELRILDYAADGGQLAADFDAGRLGLISGTVGLWHFDEGEAQRCCPAGSSCDADGGCVAPGAAPTYTVSCGDGGSCATSQSCTQSGCATSVGAFVCPAGAPVDCGNGTCCPSGDTCSNGACVKDSNQVTEACSNIQHLTAIQLSSTQVACCPTPLPGTTVTASTGANTCNNLTGAFCFYDPGTCSTQACPAGQGYVGCCDTTLGHGCYANATPSTCASGSTPCGGDTTHRGGCCPSGTTCSGPGVCCGAGESACGAGCCPDGQCVNGSCVAPPAAKVCNPACPDGTVCNNGDCIAAQPAPTVCGHGTLCGSECCPNGSDCINGTCVQGTVSITCPENLPSQCGPAGPCCRAGFTCFGNAGPGPSGFYCVGPLTGPHHGPTGPSCSNGGFCDDALVCAGGALCCPPDEPTACGTECCSAGTTCVSGHCACPTGEAVCGNECCAAGASCVGGVCTAQCASGSLCGNFCCEDGVPCANGRCACLGDHPLACGDVCCLPGATCTGDSDCGCPAGRAPCGDLCCATGDVCTNGACVNPSAGFDSTETWSGSYTGTFVSAACSGGGSSPDNSSLTLVIDHGTSVLATSGFGGTFSGTITGGTHITFGVTTSVGTVSYTGTISASAGTASGTWTESSPANSSNCSAGLAGTASGSWSAHR